MPVKLLRLAAAIAVALPLVTAPALGKAKPLPFKLGTYSGTAANGDPVKIRLYKGTCHKSWMNAITIKGLCLDIQQMPTLDATCPDGKVKSSEDERYDARLKPTGKYSERYAVVSSAVGPGPVSVLNFSFKATGAKITGSMDWIATMDDWGPGIRDCAKVATTFTAKR
jgi:hypothetical protein